MTYIVQSIYRMTVFSHSLLDVDSDLHDNPNIMALFSEVIRKECIVCPDKYLTSDPKDDDNQKVALHKIFHSAWFHTKIRADIKGVLYGANGLVTAYFVQWPNGWQKKIEI